MKTIYKKIIIFSILFFLGISTNVLSGEGFQREDEAHNKVRIRWEEVKGAQQYRIIVKEANDQIIVNSIVDNNYAEINVKPGKHKIRIGAVNKFGKVGSWSDWADIEVRETNAKGEVNVEKIIDYKRDLFDIGLKIGAGISYFYILPDWNKYYGNTYQSAVLNIAYGFRRIPFPGHLFFLKFFGISFDGSYARFNGIKADNRVKSSLENTFAGGDIFITTFDLPLNFAARGGGGAVFTAQEFQKYDNAGEKIDKGASKSTDVYYRGGIAVEYRFYSIYYIEVSADYYMIDYLIKDFNGIKVSCLFGIRL